jgi:hypothetical protein
VIDKVISAENFLSNYIMNIFKSKLSFKPLTYRYLVYTYTYTHIHVHIYKKKHTLHEPLMQHCCILIDF